MQYNFANLAKPSAIDLDALLRDYLLGLVLIAGGGSSPDEHPVQWVHVSDISDPTPFLTPRTVILTTGSQFSSPLGREEAESYVRRLQAAGTTALGVGVGLQWDRIPPSLIEACEHLQMPLFRVPYDTPFIAVVRTAARLIEAQAHLDSPLGRDGFGSPSTLARRRNLAETERALRSAVLKLLLVGKRDLAEEVSSALLPRLPRGEIAVISAPAPLSPQLLTELTAAAFEQPGVFAALDSQQLVVIAEHGDLATLQRILTSHLANCGISERGSTAELAELLEQAERAASLSLRRPETGPVAYRPEMHAGVLQLLTQSPEAVRRAQGLLSPLTHHDQRHRDDLQHSLSTWLAHHGQTSAAATALGVHRHTLRTRVSTAESLLQRDLDDPDTRAELWAALRIVRHVSSGSTGAPATSGAGSGTASGAQAPGGSTP
ncbi:MAG: PucR family transcriptional regulator ligand-binding domain-containing protein [Actinobacteria bacterium]|jgi:hypothetical protein|nr:PucR family transcriptional regulator ligand-binding domain-containing protein [Actinomycetota bacterium]